MAGITADPDHAGVAAGSIRVAIILRGGNEAALDGTHSRTEMAN
jgi:hypothetical protein